jgi:hypothetical protein
MKKILITFITAALMFTSTACFDLSEDVYSLIPADEFFKTEQDVLMYAGRAYTLLQPYPEEQMLWSLTENASDELIIPARDNGEWLEQGRWKELQQHTFTTTNKILRQSWEFVYEGISACNEVIYVVEGSPIEFAGKDRVLAEIKLLRAFFYFWAADAWGNIAFSIDYTERDAPPQKDRAFVYEYLVDEITSNVEFLQDEPTAEYYGRVTKGMAYTLLAKVYMSAQEWIGQPKWEEANAACDQIINSGMYSLEDDYFENFKIQNEGSSENIFVIVMNSLLTNDHLYWWTLTLNAASRPTFNFIGEPWDGFVLEPDFFEKYDASDVRRNAFLYGQQYDKVGNPIIVDGVPFIYTPTIANYDSRKKWEGARCAKYEYQENLQYYENDMENDFALYRYSDVLYMKLEALWRLGRTAEFIDNPQLQKIRTRAGLTPYTVGDITAEELLDERGREFAWEGHRRTDQIRFGVWGDTWTNKPPSGPNKKLFPIPQSIINVNPNMVQNP